MAERRVCVDTCVLVDVFAESAAPADRLEHSLWVLESAERGDHRLIIPALVIAETFGAPTMRPADRASRDDRAAAVSRCQAWIRDNRFLVVEVDQRLAERAGDLAQSLELKGADALVLAAAERARCEVVYTYDRQMLRKNGRPELEGLSVLAPVRVDAPEQQAIRFQ